MGDFTFPCPECHQDILCGTTLAGKDISCPICKTIISVPKEAVGDVPATAGNATAPPNQGTPVGQQTSSLAERGLMQDSVAIKIDGLVGCSDCDVDGLEKGHHEALDYLYRFSSSVPTAF